MAADPFWLDDPIALGWNASARSNRVGRWPRWIGPAIRVVIVLALIVLAWRYPAAWAVIVLLAVRSGLQIAALLGMDAHLARIERIQAQAQATTGADRLGSAIHTAGHPQLQANQPIVLALKGEVVTIYGYDSARPLASFTGRDIRAITPLAYDDDGIPRPTAAFEAVQALELKLAWKTDTCTCVFRKMLKVRAIEWYHVLSQARLA